MTIAPPVGRGDSNRHFEVPWRTRALYLARTTTGGDARDGDATARMVERRDEVEGDGLGARARFRGSDANEEARAMVRRARGEWGDEEARRAASAAADAPR